MPAAKPTQAAVRNAIKALLEEGFNPSAVVIHADGSVRIEVGHSGAEDQPQEPDGDTTPPKRWGE